MTYRFTARLYLWEARTDAWVFADLPEAVADEIEDTAPQPRRGFGAVKVEVSLGGTTWRTSALPSKEQGTMVVPIKRAVLAAEGVATGDTVELAVTMVNP